MFGQKRSEGRAEDRTEKSIMKIALNSVLESADTVLAEVRTHAPGPPGKLDITPDMQLNHAFWSALRSFA
jgi:hypothetical protein